MPVELRKYRCVQRFGDPAEAAERLEGLRHKHPNRSYVIMINVRSHSFNYELVQYEDLTMDLPREEEVLGPAPVPPSLPYGATRARMLDADWEEWTKEMRRRRAKWKSVLEPFHKQLTKKME